MRGNVWDLFVEFLAPFVWRLEGSLKSESFLRVESTEAFSGRQGSVWGDKGGINLDRD